MKLDPVSLRLFVAVMEEGTIAEAATREHIAASAVSKRLSELEQTLQTELFVRSNKGTEPTAAAFALLNLARGVLNDLDGILAQMSEYASGVRGQVRVYANISAITQFLPAELKSFMERYPQVQIHLQERISSVIAKAVADNAADIGILNDGSYGERFSLLPYHDDELVVIAPAGHALTRRKSVKLAQVLDHDVVGAHPGSVMNNLLTKAAAELGRPLRLRIQVSSYDALCLMVAAGLGIGVMPRKSAQLFLPSLKIRCVSLDEPWAARKLVLCVRDLAALSPAARLLVQHLAAPAEKS
ncbi:MAG: LysR family transcriptional regulator [Hylemonella sp.]|nr:LysR family transcriptional regulator [Hylemonella sp.]